MKDFFGEIFEIALNTNNLLQVLRLTKFFYYQNKHLPHSLIITQEVVFRFHFSSE